MILDRALTVACVATFICLSGAPVARALEVDLELVLAVDVSRSMDYEEQALQRDGYVSAFRHPEVIDAIRSGTHGRIAVVYVEWAGVATRRLVVPWTVIDGADSAARFAEQIASAHIVPASRTSLSSGLTFAREQFNGNGIDGLRRVIDVSGDGPNNQGEPVEPVRDGIVSENITINGLPILLKGSTPSGWFDIRDLDKYYEDCVIGGFGAFLVPVTDTKEFAVAVRRKLVLEIAGAPPPPARLILAQVEAPRAKIDCLIGETMWRRRWE